MKCQNIIYFEKRFPLLFFLCISIQLTALYSQTTSIPDSQFEFTLIEQGIDSDGIVNGQVLTSDIENVTTLNVVNKGIWDLTGIEGFISLENLDVSRNFLSTLDVSDNIQLKILHCSNDSSPNMTIEFLDLSNNINLELLYADDLYFLEGLNLKSGNNAILTVELSCTLDLGDPCVLPLTCVTVDDEVAATNDEPPYDTWYIAADFIYSEDCTLGIDNQKNPVFSFYPNPVENILYIENKKVVINTIKVYDAMGKLLFKTEANTNEINMNRLPEGMFFVKLETAKGIVIQKIIKQ